MRSKGFTLMELLVVVSIIGLLAALLFPVLAACRHDARMTACTANLHQLGPAIQMYEQDNAGKAPLTGPLDSDQRPYFDDPLRPYTHSGEINHCPEADYSRGKPCNDYIYRGAILLPSRPGAEDTPHLVQPLEPNSVLLYCDQHVRYHESSPAKDGQFLVLRASGRVERIDAHRTQDWGYQRGHWLPPGHEVDPSALPAQIFEVFPGEPWPPPLETR